MQDLRGEKKSSVKINIDTTSNSFNLQQFIIIWIL